MAGRVRVTSPWPGLDCELYNFETGESIVLPNHITFLRRNVYPIVRQVKTRLGVVGSASRRGDAATINRPLSRDRGNNVLDLIRRNAHREIRLIAGLAAGETRARGSVHANFARDRAVGVVLFPMMDEQDAWEPADAIVAAFRRIVDDNPPSGGAFFTGEARAAEWNPLDARLSAFGAKMRDYLMDVPSAEVRLTEVLRRGPFMERVQLVPRPIGTTGSAAARQGRSDAYELWRGFNPDQRWAVKRRDRALRILGEMCGHYRRAWQSYSGPSSPLIDPHAARWQPGMCGFLTAEEERELRQPRR